MGTGAPIFDNASSRVDIYDIITGAWSITELSIDRRFMGVISSHNKIFFAGGSYDNNSYSTRVDIYDVSANTWSTAELSEPRICMAATAGDKILFAGGTAAGSMSARVDIYDLTTNTWSTASLSSRTATSRSIARSDAARRSGFTCRAATRRPTVKRARWRSCRVATSASSWSRTTRRCAKSC